MKILVVDDEVAIRDALGRKLRRDGFNVFLAGNGIEGLRLYHAERPDLVVLDIIMPEMNGSELAQRLRGRRPGLKVLFVSGYTDATIFRHGLLAEGANFLQKPFTPHALTTKVREAMTVC